MYLGPEKRGDRRYDEALVVGYFPLQIGADLADLHDLHEWLERIESLCDNIPFDGVT